MFSPENSFEWSANDSSYIETDAKVKNLPPLKGTMPSDDDFLQEIGLTKPGTRNNSSAKTVSFKKVDKHDWLDTTNLPPKAKGESLNRSPNLEPKHSKRVPDIKGVSDSSSLTSLKDKLSVTEKKVILSSPLSKRKLKSILESKHVTSEHVEI